MNAHALAAELAPHMLWRPSSSTADLDLSTARISGALGSAKAAASTGVTSVASGLQVRLPADLFGLYGSAAMCRITATDTCGQDPLVYMPITGFA
jgi:hypothetical protein